MRNRYVVWGAVFSFGQLLAGCSPPGVPSGKWTKEELRTANECIAEVEARLKPLVERGINRLSLDATSDPDRRDEIEAYQGLEQARVVLASPPTPKNNIQERVDFEVAIKRCRTRSLFSLRRREDPAELREKALDEWDAEIRKNNEEQRTRLTKAATRMSTDSSGSVRVDAYHLKDGRVIHCTTKVATVGASIMQCDGDV